jgi:serine/threonine protein kinase
MTRISDAALAHLQALVDAPDLSATRYSVTARLGRGGMGSVFRAVDPLLGREVAVKVCTFDEAVDVERLLTEARVLATLEHPGIVPVHDAGRLPDGRAYYVMALVDGVTLSEFLGAAPALADRVRVFDRICDAVAFAHAHGVIHRDLTPHNVMIGRFGEVRVLDWGLAARAGTAAAGGTAGYMAPEQAHGIADARADVFALGAILRDLAAGAAPIPRRGPAPMQSIVGRAMAPAPDDRYPSVTALASDVRRYADGGAVSAHRETPWERTARLAATYRTSLLLVLAYLVMRLALLLWRP